MTFSVAVDGSRWRAHQDSVVDAIVHASGNIPVPVIKGNGYGLGAGILAREAMRVGADTIAVGTVFEVDNVAADTQVTNVSATKRKIEAFDPKAVRACEALGRKLDW